VRKEWGPAMPLDALAPDSESLRNRRNAVFGLLFFCSGFSSLVYQIAWQRLFTLHYGVGPAWITLTVSIYMAGLGLGSLVGGWLAEGKYDKARLYCGVELLLGIFGACSLNLLQVIGQQTAGAGYSVSFVCIAGFLLVPTVLMGTTLPILAKLWCTVQPDLALSVSRLYCLNTLGAALGSLAASFVLVSFFGLDFAVYLSSGINLTLAACVWWMGQSPMSDPQLTFPEGHQPASPTGSTQAIRWLPGLAFALGFLAIGYEIVWVRLVTVLVKDSPYAFSTILSVYLLGIALGSSMLGLLLRRCEWQRRQLLLTLQALIGAYTLISISLYYSLTKWTSLGKITEASFLHPRHPHLPGASPSVLDLWLCLDIFIWSAYFVLVPALLMGASFPLLSELAVRQFNRQGEAVARAYFATIVGNVAGGFATGFLLLPYLGTERCLLAFGIFNLFCLSLIATKQLSLWVRVGIPLLGSTLALLVFPGRGELYLLMHRGKELARHGKAYLSEGADGVVVTFVQGDSVLNYIGGQSHGGRPSPIFHALAVEALRVPKQPRRALLIGYGTGSFLEAILKLPELERVTVVELNQTLLANLRKIPLFEPLMADPRIEWVLDDGRRYLLNSKDKFDIIFMDPLRTTTAYSNNLYSQDFFRLVGAHLNPESCFLVWHDQPRVVPATLMSVFPQTRQYARFLLASPDPICFREGRKELLLQSYPVDFQKRIEGIDLAPQIGQGRGYINTDYHPISEYYCGLPFRDFLARLGL